MLLPAITLQVSAPATTPKSIRRHHFAGIDLELLRRRSNLRPPLFRRIVLSSYDPAAPAETSGPSVWSSRLTSSVGPGPPVVQLSRWNLNQKHILLLNFIACAAAVSATWLFFAAIPTLLAFKRAAESLEKLMDLTREELPDTMAAVRLSGMEISDLTMELSDLGQEITQGVRSSTRAVRLAEERLRRLTNIAPASVQGLVVHQTKNETARPVVAKTARNLREGIVKGRAIWQMFFTLTRFSRIAFGYFAKRTKE